MSKRSRKVRMKRLRKLLSLVAIPLAAAALACPQAHAAGLTVKHGTVYHNGSPYHAVGVNWFDLQSYQFFYPNDQSYISGLRALAAHHIKLVRFFVAVPNWIYPTNPGQAISVYYQYENRYWHKMDNVFHQAQRYGIGLIANLSWFPDQFTSYAGESVSQLANSNSKSAALVRQYTSFFVKRYKNSPALYSYETGNEDNLYADTGLYPFITSSQVYAIEQMISSVIRQHDHYRMIDSGASVDRLVAWHRAYEGNWITDTPAQWAQMELYFNPFAVLSAHVYDEPSVTELRSMVALGKKWSRPVVVGEFGVQDAEHHKWEFYNLAHEVFHSGAPIALLWDFHSNLIPNFIWSATFNNSLRFELNAVSHANK